MKKYLLLGTSIVVIIFSILVSVPGSPFLLGGMTQADISALYPTPITPAGFTFSIWSLIYISWIILGLMFLALHENSVFSRLRSYFSHERVFGESEWHFAKFFALGIFLTALWLIPWGYDLIGLAFLILFLIFWVFSYLFHEFHEMDRVFRIPLELTLGWVHIAFLANLAVWIESVGLAWLNHDPILQGSVFLLGAFLVTVFYQIAYRTYIISGVFLWALVGVGVAHHNLLGAVIFFFLSTIVTMAYSLEKK